MAKKKKEKLALENIELRPQVVGVTYKRKSNFIRVIIIFVIFMLVIFYIDNISLFINNLLGIQTAETIKDNTENKGKVPNKEDSEKEEVVYNTISDNLEIDLDTLKLNNFSYYNNSISFDVLNNSNTTYNANGKKIFLETYSEEKTLLERFKVDITNVSSSAKLSFKYDAKIPFTYITISEKSVDDYPAVSITKDENGNGIIDCTKGIENIVYTFRNDELTFVRHTITDTGVTDQDYTNRFNTYRTKTMTYSGINGINATLNSTESGYTAIITLDLQIVNATNVTEKTYFSYKEIPKVVMFEMQTYGFNCK